MVVTADVFGHPAAGGWPEFIVWPRFTTIVHQQAYIDWLYRAYQGGLRLATCLAVNNELLATKSNPRLPPDDRSAIQAQVAGMRAMVTFVDQQSGGAGHGWLQIASSPDEARKIIGENKLAVILGVEVDSLGNWRKVEDLEAACQGDATQARLIIGAELDWLHSLGVRQITPIQNAMPKNAVNCQTYLIPWTTLESVRARTTPPTRFCGSAWCLPKTEGSLNVIDARP